MLAVMKPCGHVTCKTCTETLVKPAKQCIVCDVKLGDKDIIELSREGARCCVPIGPLCAHRNLGTGYAAGGLAETSKRGVAFQG